MSRVRTALVSLVLMHWRTFYREPSAIFWTFGFPLLLALALGSAFRSRPPAPATVAVEPGPAAEAIRDTLAKSPEISPELLDSEVARAALHTGKVDLVVVPGPPHTYRFDPTRPEARVAQLVVDDALQRAAGRVDPVPVVEAQVTDPGSRYIDVLVPGLLGMGLMLSGLWGIGYTIVEMRTHKTIKRMAATPMRRSDFLLSFILNNALFLIGELPLLLLFGVLVFDVPVRGSIGLLLGIATLGSLAFAGLGLLMSARVQNTQAVSGLISLVSMPMFVLSGTFFSASRFPDAAQPFVRALPLTALNDALRAVMLDGAGLSGVARPVLVLLAWGAVSFTAALKMFRWQ